MFIGHLLCIKSHARIVPSFNPPLSQEKKSYYFPYFSNEEIEAQIDYEIFSRFHLQELEFKLSIFYFLTLMSPSPPPFFCSTRD
jgi:hypothetical protein